jgi:hypothetical protein
MFKALQPINDAATQNTSDISGKMQRRPKIFGFLSHFIFLFPSKKNDTEENRCHFLLKLNITFDLAKFRVSSVPAPESSL